MLLFLIPVIILAGATSVGIAAEIAQSKAPAAQSTVTSTETPPAPPAAPNRTR